MKWLHTAIYLSTEKIEQKSREIILHEVLEYLPWQGWIYPWGMLSQSCWGVVKLPHLGVSCFAIIDTGIGIPTSSAWSCAQYIHTSHVVDTHWNTTIYPVSYMLGKHYALFQHTLKGEYKCVVLLSYVLLTWFGECVVVRIHCGRLNVYIGCN